MKTKLIEIFCVAAILFTLGGGVKAIFVGISSKAKKNGVICLLLLLAWIWICSFIIYRIGVDNGSRQIDSLKESVISWKYAAEHYGGICKWLLEKEPIYGTIVMEANSTIKDCFIVSGSKDAMIDVAGNDCLVSNNYFKALDMDWVMSTTPVDPNEYLAYDPNNPPTPSGEIKKISLIMEH